MRTNARTNRYWTRVASKWGVEFRRNDQDLPEDFEGTGIARPWRESDGFVVDKGKAGRGSSEDASKWPELEGLWELAAVRATLGMRWKRVSTSRPTRGRELSSPALAAALPSNVPTLTLTAEGWAAFGIHDLRNDDFILSHPWYWEPEADQQHAYDAGSSASLPAV